MLSNKKIFRKWSTGRVVSIASLLLMAIAGQTSVLAMNTEEKLLFANGLYRRGLYELAIPEYQMLLTNETARPMHDLSAFRLGECYRNLNRPEDAAASYDLVVEKYPDSQFFHRAAYRRAELDWQAGRLKDGAGRFEKVLGRNPPNDIESASLYYLGLCQAGIDQFKEAEKSWRRIIKNHARSPYADYACLALADLLSKQQGNDKEVFGLLNKIIDEPETPALGAEATAKAGLLSYRNREMAAASGYFAALGEKYPGDGWNARVRLEASWAFLLDGKIDEARSLAHAGLKDAKKAERPDWLYALANIERNAGSFAESKKYYDEFLAAAPQHVSAAAAAYEACGMAYQQSEYERVLELSILAEGDPEKELAILWMRAGAMKELGQTAQAITVYEQIVRDYPDSDRAPSAAYQLAWFSEQKKDYDAASKGFETVAEKYRNSPLAADALMAAASVYMRDHKTEEAIAAWRKLAAQYPDYAMLDEAYIGLARTEVELNKNEEAAKSLQSLISVYTNSRYLAEAHYMRGTLYEQENQFEEAEFHYLRAISLKPVPSLVKQIQHRRVAVLQRQGRNDDAANLMNKLLEGDQESHLPSPLLEWLARWNLENKKIAQAETAALRLAETGDTAGWKQVGWYIAGVAALGQKKQSKAMDAFTAAAGYELNTRETAEAYFQLGEISLEKKRWEDAAGFFSKAAERATSDSLMDIRARSYLKLGISYEAMENWAEAGRYYLSGGVLFDDPTLTPESLYRAAGALHAQLKNDERASVVAELRERFPDSEWTVRAGERWPVVQP